MLPAAALAAVATLAAPAAALAATPTVTDDSGTAVPLSGAVIRNMEPSVGLTFAAGEARYALSVTGPGGAEAAFGTTCRLVSSFSTEEVAYQGNGTYTATWRTTDSNDCDTLGPPQSASFTINASTAVAAPGPVLLTRRPDEFALLSYPFAVDVNPGADSTELKYAAGATIGPDGAIVGSPASGFVDTSTGIADISFSTPGRYTFVARASDFSGAATAWSPPVVVTVLAPFDFVGNPIFADSRGPKYRVVGTVREKSARGRIKVSIAKGRKGGRFRKLRTVKIKKDSRFSVKFTLRKKGRYRLRYRYKGNATTASGTAIQGIRISRRVFF
jgi:hypothetical protein